MTREIKSEKEVRELEVVKAPNDYKERLLKLIPTEIVTAYITIAGIIEGFKIKNDETILWTVILVLVFITPLYLYKLFNVVKKGQLFFSTIGFFIWALATHSPIKPEDTANELPVASLASIALIIYTLCIPIFYKGEKF
ncbi:hypothetical protein [Flavobacterium sp. GCM10023249]|uniref:hypothetical protein n=1 Tax=unclassified Flavobacterium TaxID=196869 RepID=UPI0036215333